jgi:hypothetical protein
MASACALSLRPIGVCAATVEQAARKTIVSIHRQVRAGRGPEGRPGDAPAE